MKKLVLFLICFLVFVNYAGAGNFDNDEDIVSLESSNIEYRLGGIEKDSLIEQTIRVRNDLEEPLALKEARSTCECLESFSAEQVVDRGEIFEVAIDFDARGIGPGDIEEVVYILTDNMGYEIIRLVILATIIDSE